MNKILIIIYNYVNKTKHKLVFITTNILEKYDDFFFFMSIFSFIFFRLNNLLKLNIDFLIIFLIVIFFSFIIFKKIEFAAKIIQKNNVINYVFYNFIIFKEIIYEILFTQFNFSFKEKASVYFILFCFGAIFPFILYKNIDYILSNIIFFFFFYLLKFLICVRIIS
jgi:hypothetical protein